MTSEVKPRLRPIEITPFSVRGEDYYHFHDRNGLAPDVQVARALGPLLALFDGSRTPAEIVSSYEARGGQVLPIEFVLRVIEQMDEAYLLDSPRFAAHYKATLEEFAVSPVRPAAFAGTSYPDAPEGLRDLLGNFFKEAEQLDQPPITIEPLRQRGIVVPHIDFTRGGPVEALAYRQFSDQQFDVFIVLGIAHSGVEYPFCATAKDYDTPLGAAHVDAEFVAALQERVGERFTAEQFAHKSEHSIEFVAVFLQYLEELKHARMVPILCGGFHSETRTGKSPLLTPDIAQFCNALREVVGIWEVRGLRVGLIASVDLSHVGSRFGDDTTITKKRLAEIETADREFLRCAEIGSAEALHSHIARDNNARNVDAHPALYTLLTAFPELRGQLLHYAQAFDSDANSLVSFASMALFEP